MPRKKIKGFALIESFNSRDMNVLGPVISESTRNSSLFV